MTDPKLSFTLETILYVLFLLAYNSGNRAALIILCILIVFYMIFSHHDRKVFFNLLDSLGNTIKVEPKEFFRFSLGFFFRIAIILVFVIFILKNLKTNETRSFLFEFAILVFPLVLQLYTMKTNKAKGRYYLSDSGIFAPKKQGEIIGWNEIERFENHSKKDHYIFHLKNEEMIMVEKKSSEAEGVEYEEEFTKNLLCLVKSKLSPNQVFEIY